MEQCIIGISLQAKLHPGVPIIIYKKSQRYWYGKWAQNKLKIIYGKKITVKKSHLRIFKEKIPLTPLFLAKKKIKEVHNKRSI